MPLRQMPRLQALDINTQVDVCEAYLKACEALVHSNLSLSEATQLRTTIADRLVDLAEAGMTDKDDLYAKLIASQKS